MLLQDAKPSARTRAAKLWATLFYGHVHRMEDRDAVVKTYKSTSGIMQSFLDLASDVPDEL